MELIETYLNQVSQIIQEAGFDRLPRGWTKDSVRKYARTLSSKIKGGPKTNPKKFFYTCVKKLEGEFKEPEAFCAALMDELFGSTKWRKIGR